MPVGAAEVGDKVKKIVGIKKAMTKTMTAALSVPTNADASALSPDSSCTAPFP